MRSEESSPLGVYIHVPFCRRKCRYCDFYSTEYDEHMADAFVAAVLREWDAVAGRDGLVDTPVATVYIGGGTPSTLSAAQWERLLAGLRDRLRLADGWEWTTECNPESFDADTARLWLDAGVNRVSLGVQSLDDRELRLLGRPHSASQALAVLASPLLGRFSSLSADLMYALPGQSPEALASTVQRLLDAAHLHHVSAYELTLGPRTPLGRHRRLLPLPTDERSIEMLEFVGRRLGQAGLGRYEVSNYARPGHRCRHNMAYWRHQPYIGLGPAAHSFVPPVRRANVADVGQYLRQTAETGSAVVFEERLGRQALCDEVLMLSLRTSDGVGEERFRRLTGEPFASTGRAPVVKELLREGLMQQVAAGFALTDAGMRVADAIAVRLASV